jgi:lysozyme family protein
VRFNNYIGFILEDEGGYVNHPSDPGGETKYGISKRAYPDLNIKRLTKEKAAEIYKRDYWYKSKADLLSRGLDYMHFDNAVNCGITGAAKMLQRAAGVDDDGIIGPITLAAAKNTTLEAYCIQRSLYYLRLGKVEFSKGWANRLEKVYNRGLSMK